MSWTSPFSGYLIQAVNTGVSLPLTFIKMSSYEATPNQREEIKAYRDDNTRDLTRITASGKKSTIKLKIRPLNLREKIDFQNWLNQAIGSSPSDQEQRRSHLRYWDDDQNVYKTGYFYTPNPVFKIKKINGTMIWYDEQELKFVEY